MNNNTINILPENFQPLPIYFHTVCSRYNQVTTARQHGIQDFHQILLVIDGSGILKYKGQTYELKKGCAFFTAQGVPSKYINTGGLTSAFLTARGDGITQMLKYFDCDGFLFYKSVDLEKYLSDISKIIQEYYEHKRQSILSALTYSFYINFFEEQQENNFVSLDKTALYIEKNFTKKLSLAQLAEINQSSVSKLCHDFKSKYGCTVFQQILNLRLTYAHNLLSFRTDVKTRDVANACGFDDISYFCRAYKQKFGSSPSKRNIKEN